MRPSPGRTADAQGRPRRPTPQTAPGRTTVPDLQAATRPDLVVRNFQPGPTARDARWCGDTTCIPTEEGGPCLATVIDIASRRVVGWATADHLRTEPVADALRAACKTRVRTGP